MTASVKLRLLILFIVLGCTIGCDQTSKQIARTKLGRLGYVTLPGGLGELRIAENSGSFLSLGSSLPEPLRVGLLTFGVGVGLLVLFGYLARSPRLSRLSFFALALVWAGGTSNFIDRATRHGRVTDFVFLQAGPLHTGVFNAADVLIMIGVAVLAWDLWQQGKKNPKQNPK
ncbi:signal peptidase II [Pedosphaera parvula]|uniref:Lipoprotein signal peptidase n=1 Tax=Pedosphaera parvula (strain Ellin514) TaxID=320771 RepID=B9XBD3_PEDPL|nr:signal peptidase II [Pedosphaera parvula]EEF62818.1 lipoprotein signal peptidase [Pedosphaera parvula Ellin514]